MELLIANWGDDCNGSQFTLHTVESLSPMAIHCAIDSIGCPSECKHVILEDSDRRVTMEHLSTSFIFEMEHSGFIDNEELEDWLLIIWNKYHQKRGDGNFVYLMKDSANGLYKIGKSVRPKYRERTLQSEKPSVKMVFSTPERPDLNERLLHLRYADQRKRGEWFQLTPAQVRFICHNFTNNNHK